MNRNLIKENQVVVLSGETGCGKSTQVPQFILESIEAGLPCNILVSQPRRISAMGLAERVAADVRPDDGTDADGAATAVQGNEPGGARGGLPAPGLGGAALQPPAAHPLS